MSAFFDIETPPEPKRPAVTERVRALWDSLRAHPQHRLIASAAAALTVAAAAGGVTAALAGMDRHEPAPRRVVSDLSMTGFLNHIRGMDDAMLALAARFDQPGRFGAGAPPSPDPMAEILPTVLASASEESPVFRWQALSPDQARLINASLPVSTSPNPAARPFRLKADSAVESLRALDCLTAAVYYEAAKGATLASRRWPRWC